MSNRTKQDLEASLKRLMHQKPLDKITIQELTTDCGISRMTFYYHFQDIYDLAEWACIEDASAALQDKNTYATWTEGFLQIFQYVYDNKSFILNIYRSMGRERVENFLFQITSDLIKNVAKEQAEGQNIQDKDLQFIANFYTYSFVGILLDWIKQGMKEDYPQIVEKISKTMKGDIANSIRNFS